eukprot:TRINITY_DN12461_c0_g1_i1.p1 TRINITY_DN12461_c0_g1~~TRINITY_DN12461_c0_g1_i1.p1  ORF type:complete len:331 (+),score=89.15 TRINITY_DN12461_c0_g1_i1:62-1054(+)
MFSRWWSSVAEKATTTTTNVTSSQHHPQHHHSQPVLTVHNTAATVTSNNSNVVTLLSSSTTSNNATPNIVSKTSPRLLVQPSPPESKNIFKNKKELAKSERPASRERSKSMGADSVPEELQGVAAVVLKDQAEDDLSITMHLSHESIPVSKHRSKKVKSLHKIKKVSAAVGPSRPMSQKIASVSPAKEVSMKTGHRKMSIEKEEESIKGSSTSSSGNIRSRQLLKIDYDESESESSDYWNSDESHSSSSGHEMDTKNPLEEEEVFREDHAVTQSMRVVKADLNVSMFKPLSSPSFPDLPSEHPTFEMTKARSSSIEDLPSTLTGMLNDTE